MQDALSTELLEDGNRARTSSGGARPMRRRLRPCVSPEDLLRAPIGRYYIGRGWLAFYEVDFSGVVFWAELSEAKLEEVRPVFDARHAPHIDPHPSFFDVRFVDKWDPRALAMRSEYHAQHEEALAKHVTRFAMIHGGGLSGAVAIGIHHLLPPPFPEKLFTDPAEALQWLDRADRMSVLGELDHVREHASGITPILQKLRTLLDTEQHVTLGDASRAIGLSARALQRQLAASGTSFQEEAQLARVRLAQSLLLDRGANISEIAFRVGCSSSQHLSTLFRKHIGETPTGWRARQTGESAPSALTPTRG